MMSIAIASGKGGTGKTTLATNLAYVASHSNNAIAYLDCDVEEPNGHIFLKPAIYERLKVERPVPRVDMENCTLCGMCGDICQFSAIVLAGSKVVLFHELCHACGGCSLVCPANAIMKLPHKVGELEIGRSGPIYFAKGKLNVGEAMSVPVIRAVKNYATEADIIFIDAPPGTSCPVIESVRNCDYVILVTEPTPFGLNDLELAVEMVRALKIPFGVVINRAGVGDDNVQHYCRQNKIDILAEIPDSRDIAEVYSRGGLICEALPEHKAVFSKMLEKIIGNGVKNECCCARRKQEA